MQLVIEEVHPTPEVAHTHNLQGAVLPLSGDNFQFVNKENHPTPEVAHTHNLRGAVLPLSGDNIPPIIKENHPAREVGAFAQPPRCTFTIEWG